MSPTPAFIGPKPLSLNIHRRENPRNLKRLLLAVLWVTVFLPSMLFANDPGTDYDPYGGWKKKQATKTGFFHAEKIGRTWWLVSPEGNVFFSKGINSVHPPGKPAFSGNEAPVAAGFLKSWGMNTAGCWSDPALAGEKVAVAYRAKITGGSNTRFPDVFDPAWKESVAQKAREICTPLADNPWILGYFTDNELPWKHDDEADAFLELFLKLPASAPGHQAALKAQAEGKDAVEKFRVAAAEIYFTTTANAIRSADPHHMILGCRFAGRPPLAVAAQMKGRADVISFNNYSRLPPVPLIQGMSDAAGLPVLVTEFSFKGPAGNTPQPGSGPVMDSQSDRAKGFENYVRTLSRLECCVGYHWFKWAEGWQGALQDDGQPWPELTAAFARLNDGLEAAR